MRNSPPIPRTPKRPSLHRLRWFTEHRVAAVSLLIATIGLLVTVIGTVAQVISTAVAVQTAKPAVSPVTPENRSPNLRPQPVGSAPASSTPPQTMARGSVAKADCVTSGGQKVSCSTIHQFQIVSLDPADCSPDALVRYLGGNPRLEVLLKGPRHFSLPDSITPACVLEAPGAEPLSAPQENVLQRGEGSQWRRCYNAGVDTDVACSDPHTAEYVRSGTPDASGVAACTAAAAEYMQTSLRRVEGELSVETIGEPPSQMCRIKVTSRNMLVGSLRNLRTGPIPYA